MNDMQKKIMTALVLMFAMPLALAHGSEPHDHGSLLGELVHLFSGQDGWFEILTATAVLLVACVLLAARVRTAILRRRDHT